MLGVGLSTLFETKYGWLAIPISLGLVTWLVLASADETSAWEERRIAARDLWLSQCEQPIAACAREWDDGRTLRQLYLERIEAQELISRP